jgi:hypothetical protein
MKMLSEFGVADDYGYGVADGYGVAEMVMVLLKMKLLYMFAFLCTFKGIELPER